VQNARRAGTSADRSYQEEAEFFAKYEREEDEAAQRPAGPVNPADDLTADRNDDTYTGYGIHHSSHQVCEHVCCSFEFVPGASRTMKMSSTMCRTLWTHANRARAAS
jgi:hypothetical protein